MPEAEGKSVSVFGELPTKGVHRSGKPPVEGQRVLGLGKQIDAGRRKLSAARPVAPDKGQEVEEPWETLILNEGIKGKEVLLHGKSYDMHGDKPLGVYNIPPRTGKAIRLGSVREAKVFVIKDSEKAEDPRRKGWADVVIFKPSAQGEKPRIRRFNDGFMDITVCRMWYKGILSRSR